MLGPDRITLATLGVTDLARSTAFYEALGWRQGDGRYDGVAFFQSTTTVLALWVQHELSADLGDDPPPGPTGPARSMLAVNFESEAAVDEFIATARAAGAEILVEAKRADWGGYNAYFADPDGHVWEAAYNPGFGLDADGRIILP